MINYNDLEIRRLDKEDVNDILLLQEKIINSLTDKSVLRINSKEMFESCVVEPNLSLGLYDSNKMIALIIFVDARGSDEDLGVGLEKYEVNVNGNFKLILVDEDYRGNKLMFALMKVLDSYASSKGYSDLCVTVSPDNSFSLNNILKDDYKIDHLAIKYGGNKRYVCVKKLDNKFNDSLNIEACFISYQEPFIYGSIVENKDGQLILYKGQNIENIKRVYIPSK